MSNLKLNKLELCLQVSLLYKLVYHKHLHAQITTFTVYCKSGNFRAQLFSRFADFELFHLFLNSRF